jgi:hypothetical protein
MLLLVKYQDKRFHRHQLPESQPAFFSHFRLACGLLINAQLPFGPVREVNRFFVNERVILENTGYYEHNGPPVG